MAEIINKVANSKLKTIDLEDYYVKGKRVLFDLKKWLFKDIILKEKDFRVYADTYDWNSLKNTYLALTCSADAIVPSWAYPLVATKAAPFTKKIVVGNLVALETAIYQDTIRNLDVSSFKGKPIIIKGCNNKTIPLTAYTLLIEKLLPVAKSIMYGEACSTVPLYKAKK